MQISLKEIKEDYSLKDLENLKQLLNQICEDKRKQTDRSQTVNAFSREYLEYIRNTFSESYLKSVKLSFKHLLESTGCETDIGSIGVKKLDDFKIYLVRRAPRGYAVYIRTLKAAFNVAVNWSLIPENPFLKIKLGKNQECNPVFLTREEFDNILECAKSEEIKKIFLFAFLTGCRLGEILNLKSSNVDLRKRIFTIGDRSYSTKNKKARDIPITNEIYSLICSNIHKNSGNDQFIFTKKNQFPYNRDYISRAFKRARRSAQLDERIHFHSLRHSFASNLAINGVPLITIKELLGHSSIISTQIYSHSNIHSKMVAMEKLSNLQID